MSQWFAQYTSETGAGRRTSVDDFWPVADVLAYLAGSWRVERSVRDHASGAEGTFRGTTDFAPLEAGGLLHHESGTFVWQGVARPAERTLRFLPGTAPSRADVRFADGRPFHDLDLASGRRTPPTTRVPRTSTGASSPCTTRTTGEPCGKSAVRTRT